MLNHFGHRPQEGEDGDVGCFSVAAAAARVTKTIQEELPSRNLLVRVDPAPGDARSKLLTITPKGLELHARAVAAFVPQFAEVYSGWDDAEMADLFAKLDRLKVWLDTKGRE